MLISAAYHDQLQIAKFLVEEVKVDLNEKLKSGETALYRACYFNRVSIVEYLLEKGANTESDTMNLWNSPLFQSCYRDKEKCVDLLLQYGADIHFERFGGKFDPESPFTEKFYRERKPKVQ
jgi:ankyrin repeat protein